MSAVSGQFSSTKLSLYSLIVRQLIDDGFAEAAEILSSATETEVDQTIPNNSLLSALQNQSIAASSATAAAAVPLENPAKKRKLPSESNEESTTAGKNNNSNAADSTDIQVGVDLDETSKSNKSQHNNNNNNNNSNMENSSDSIPADSLSAYSLSSSLFPPFINTFTYSHKDCVRSAVYSSDGAILASGSLDSTLKILDLRLLPNYEESLADQANNNSANPPKPPIRNLTEHEGSITDIAAHPFDTFIISASKDSTLRIWNYAHAHHRKPQRTVELADQPLSIHFHPAADHLLISTTRNYPLLMDLSSFTTFISRDLTNNGHSNRINYCRWNDRGSAYLTASRDGTVKLWDGQNFQCQQTIIAHGNQEVNSAIFSPNGNYFLTSGKDSTVRLWDTRNYRQIQLFTGFTHQRNTIPAIFDQNGEFILTSDENSNSIFAFDIKTGEIIKRLSGHNKPPRVFTLNPTDRSFASAGDDLKVKIWNIKDD